MDPFTIEIAGAAGLIHCSFSSTKEYFRRYLTDRSPEYSVQVQPEDLRYEQQMLDEEADAEGLRRRIFTAPFLERAVIQRQTAAFLLGRNTLLLHGSTIAYSGKAYLFTAACGVGKSTHTKLWRELLGDQVTIINDDRAFLQLQGNQVLAYGSPWSGKHGLDNNLCFPLGGICILERGTENRIAAAASDDVLPFLIHQTFLPQADRSADLHRIIALIAMHTPIWNMHCTKSIDAAQLAFSTMTKNFHAS